MFSHFFIERPIFASVLSIVITLAGAVAVLNLPLAQYPPITPPSIMVMCNYPGANAQVVADSVAAPIEQQINGVEDMLYMVSQSNNDGSYTLTVTFKPGVNLNFAQVLVQNRINLALPLLPDVVKQAGVTTRKRNPDILQVIAVYSPNDRYDQLYLSNFVTLKIKDELSRVEGVGDCMQFGQQDYCMRLWLDPDQLAGRNLSASDVINAIREQNFQVAAGHFGQQGPPGPGAQRSAPFEYTIATLGRLQSISQFEDIILRTDGMGRTVRLKDVGYAKLGARNEDSTSKVNGKPNGSLAVFALPDANAIEVAGRVRKKMEELKKSFPEDIDYIVSLDLTPFIEESIKEVIRTLVEGVALVSIVVLLFLQNWRSALIPLVAVPVAIVGTFAVMIAIGFSLNNLTLFGLVLAIGIVVDDAIVVVEAVEYHIEHGLSPRRAAHTAMDQVSGPVVAVALVLSAVFVPCAFISGITGQFFRQFALTIAVSTVISAFNSLTLSPALAAILLKPHQGSRREPLPRLAASLAGAGLGLVLVSRGGPSVWAAGALVGAVSGWLLGPRLAARAMNSHPEGGLASSPRVRRLVILSFAAVGGWLGMCYLAPWAGQGLTALARKWPGAAPYLRGVAAWGQWWASGVLAGALLGWLGGPALVRLLARGIRDGIRLPLPRLAFFVLGGWLGYKFLGPLVPTIHAVPYLSQALAGLAGGVAALLAARALNWLLGWFFAVFNLAFKAGTDAYSNAVSLLLRASAGVLVVYGLLLVLTWWVSTKLPPGYIPNQDQGRFYIAVQLPDAASLERTQEVVDRTTRLVKGVKGVLDVTGIAGQSFTLNANGSNFAQFFITFSPFEERREPDMTADEICNRVRKLLEDEIPEAKMAIFTPPAVSGLGSASGFKIIIEDRGDLGIVELQKQVDRVIAAANGGRYKLSDRSFKSLQGGHAPLSGAVLEALEPLRGTEYQTKELFETAVGDALIKAGVDDKAEREHMEHRILASAVNRKVVSNLFSVFRANVPQLYADLDRDQCQSLGVDPKEVFETLQVYLGSLYINDFNLFERTWQVVAQARGEFRTNPERVKLLKVRNAYGEMVPLGAVLKIKEIGGPINIGRYNMYPAAAILGQTEKGVSTGQGIEEMEAVCNAVLPPGMAFEWTEINFMQIDADKNIWNKLIFPLAVMFVFLVLAAQYESWALPGAVILVVPMCILGSLTGVAVTGGDINIFTQIGFVVLVGLASKNAILIVEFAKHKREDAKLSRRDATLEACKLRLRPILMTSFAFILGVFPLIMGHGAGAEMRRVLGVAVFSGMLGVTLFGIFLTPVFFYVIEGFVEDPLFSSRRLRAVGRTLLIALGILALGLPWWLPYVLGRRRRQLPVKVIPLPAGVLVPAHHNGNGNGTDGAHAAPTVNGNGVAATGGPAGVTHE